RGRAGVEDDRAAVGQLVEGSLRDAFLLACHPRLAVCDRGLDAEPLDGDRAAVHAAQKPAPLEECQVAADRLWGHVEGLGELAHLDPAVLARSREDLLLPLRRV